MERVPALNRDANKAAYGAIPRSQGRSVLERRHEFGNLDEHGERPTPLPITPELRYELQYAIFTTSEERAQAATLPRPPARSWAYDLIRERGFHEWYVAQHRAQQEAKRIARKFNRTSR